MINKTKKIIFMSLSLLTPFSMRADAPQFHSVEEVNHQHSLYSITSPNEEGYLQVSEIHRLFYATYGNPNGIPVVVLHGGPGAGCEDSLTRFFDLDHWHVVMFDQRGAMRSQPFACMEDNSPQHSISDIEKLRKHLGIEQWVIFGGSWGSTLAVLYGQEHPESCLGFILRGVFLARQQDYLHLFYGMGKVFPETYAELIHFLPEEERHDVLTAYYRRIMDPNPEVHLPAARAFMKFDTICGSHLPNPKGVNELLQDDQLVLSISRAFVYYSFNGFFLEPNQILSRMDRVSHLPAIIVHGRWDAICLPEMAYLLHQKWENSLLWFATQGGHFSHDPAIAASLATATDAFVQILENKDSVENIEGGQCLPAGQESK
jgi:proline iminopeptidase